MALFETPPHGMDATAYGAGAVLDVNRLTPGGLELNIEA